MTDRRTPFGRFLSPNALFAGIACSFLACCVAGEWAGRRNHFHHFERFHAAIAPETLFFPTASQVRSLARSRLDRTKVVVVVGGSSILHGTGQTSAQVWTQKLQALLGDRYQVLNLGFRCARTVEIGAPAAEVLSRDFPRLLFVGDLFPGILYPDPDGNLFRYFFWDAYSRGWLLPHPRRDARLRELAREERPTPRPTGPSAAPQPLARAELQKEMRLDAALHFNDLWNSLAYTRFATVWTPQTGGGFLRPRRRYPDGEPGAPPPDQRYGDGEAGVLAILRKEITEKCARDGRGDWVENEAGDTWETLDRAAQDCFPPAARPRTLLLVTGFSPHYLNRLTPGERGGYAALSRLTAAHLGRLGFSTLEIGPGFSAADYADPVHMAEAGGAKMARLVAARVRTLARRLGYVEEGVEP